MSLCLSTTGQSDDGTGASGTEVRECHGSTSGMIKLEAGSLSIEALSHDTLHVSDQVAHVNFSHVTIPTDAHKQYSHFLRHKNASSSLEVHPGVINHFSHMMHYLIFAFSP
jgi:hypothetical protein